jgi:tRNA pseudouridine38-40 synthase
LLDINPVSDKFSAMPERTVQLVLQYDGSRFVGWQRQPSRRTVQGVLESVLERLFERPATVVGAGRTDAGVHARGQSAHIRVGDRWNAVTLRRALNALLPPDIWVATAHDVADSFHARYSAIARRYTYLIGTDEEADSPFRRPFEWRAPRVLDTDALAQTAAMLLGEHRFYGFAVRGTAPATDEHRCEVTTAEWRPRAGGLMFVIEANRFLHHMVRFLVGTMVEAATGRRSVAAFAQLLEATDNSGVAPPAPAHALFLDHVTYPQHLYSEGV